MSAVVQAVAGLDLNACAARRFANLSRHLQDAIRINQEFHFNARQARRRRAEHAT